MAITSLIGLYYCYCQTGRARRIKETIEMMKFIADKAKDPSLTDTVRAYERSCKSRILDLEEERIEIEEMLVTFAEKFYSLDTMMQLYRTEAEFGIPDELPRMNVQLMNEHLEKIAHNNRFLKRQISPHKDELSINEMSDEELEKETREKERQQYMDQEIAAMVDKDIIEFFKPKSLLTQELQNEIEQLGQTSTRLSPNLKTKRSATATMNTSMEQPGSLEYIAPFSFESLPIRPDSYRKPSPMKLNITEGATDLSAFLSSNRTARVHSASPVKKRKGPSFQEKWKIPLGNHASICKAVRDHAPTPMHKQLGEIIIGSFKNNIETCRPVSE